MRFKIGGHFASSGGCNKFFISKFYKKVLTNLKFTALLLLMNSGMHIGWSIFNILNAETWKLEATFEEIIWTQISWFLGIAVGSLIAGLLVDITGRRHTQVTVLYFCYI